MERMRHLSGGIYVKEPCQFYSIIKKIMDFSIEIGVFEH